MAEDEENNNTPWALIFLGILMLFLAVFFFMGVSAVDQAAYQPSSYNKMGETLFGSPDLSYKPGASLMSA